MLLNCPLDCFESPLDCKEIKPVNPKGNQSLLFIGGTDVEAKAPILWPPDMKSQLTGKDPDAGKDWRQEEKGIKEDEMVGWHHQLNGHEFEQIPGDGDGQGSLASCSPRYHKRVRHNWMTEQQQFNSSESHQHPQLLQPDPHHPQQILPEQQGGRKAVASQALFFTLFSRWTF